MPHNNNFRTVLALAGFLAAPFALGGQALAQEAIATVEPATPSLPSGGLAAPPVRLPDLGSFEVSDDALENLHGKGATIAVTDQDLTAMSTGNTINAATVGSGAINLSDNALGGFGGLGNVLMNTGHNNVLQGNVSVTIVVTQ